MDLWTAGGAACSRYRDCSNVLDTALLQDLPFPFPVAVVTLKTGSQGGLVRNDEILSEFQ
jgi:hypothetical protein